MPISVGQANQKGLGELDSMYALHENEFQLSPIRPELAQQIARVFWSIVQITHVIRRKDILGFLTLNILEFSNR